MMALTNKIHDAFGYIQADARLKEGTKQFLRKQSREKSVQGYHRVMKYAVSAVCGILFMVMGGVGYSWILRPVSYVSIDVNPSIELALNRFDRVVSAEAYNAEGEEILDGLPLKWKKYTEAIDTVIGSERMRLYLTDTSQLVLTVVTDSTNEAKLTEGVKACTSYVEGGCHSTQADINAAPQAHENGVSCGKYKAYLELLQYDSSITLDECRKMSMEERWERIREYEEGGEDDGIDGTGIRGEDSGNEDGPVSDVSETGEETGCGYGYGNGNGERRGQRYGNGSSHHGRGHHGEMHE